ncbi:MAG: hypothetical protein IIA67_00430 [Planctomycetes bacterium]|nr:hypothetical protein [Planctomycetota bacterium]
MLHDNISELQPASPGKLVEIFGPAGTGKSSVTEILMRRVDGYQFGYQLSKRRHAWRVLLRTLARGPAATGSLLFGSSGARRCAKRLVYLDVLYDVLKLRTLKNRSQDNQRGIFFDQGPLHLICDLHPSNNEFGEPGVAAAWWHAQVARWSNSLDVVVVLEAPVETIIRRVLDRKKDHRLYCWIKDRTPQDAIRLMETHVAMYREALDVLAGGMVRVLSFDSTQQSAEAIAQEIIDRCGMPVLTNVPLVGPKRSESDTPTGAGVKG